MTRHELLDFLALALNYNRMSDGRTTYPIIGGTTHGSSKNESWSFDYAAFTISALEFNACVNDSDETDHYDFLLSDIVAYNNERVALELSNGTILVFWNSYKSLVHDNCVHIRNW
jgi:hypothetical protein